MSGRRLLLVSAVLVHVAAGALAGAVLLLAGDDGAAAPEPPAGDTVEVHQRAPNLAGDDPVTGDRYSLARVKGKPIVLTVWSSWCGACDRRARALETFARRQEEHAVVVGLDLQDDPADAEAFYERHGWTFRSIADPDGSMAARLGIGELPTTLFLDPGRLIVARLEGPASRAELEDGLAQASRGS